MGSDAASNLALSLKQLRSVRGLTQLKLAQLSGVPRPTIANLETGGANPTLQVMTRIAAALQVSLEELVSPPRAMARLYKADQLRSKVRGKVVVRQLLPDTIPGVVVERMWMPKGAAMKGVPHKPGTREYLTCESGHVQLTASGELYRLEPGDVVIFRGDQKHGYANIGRSQAVAYSVVMPAS